MLRAMNCLGFSLARLDRRLRARHRHPPGSVAVMGVFPRQQGALGKYPRASPRLLRMARESALANLVAENQKMRHSGVKGLKLVALSRWQALALGVALTFAVSAGWAASTPTLTATAVHIIDHPGARTWGHGE
jgi:hypothetical protein